MVEPVSINAAHSTGRQRSEAVPLRRPIKKVLTALSAFRRRRYLSIGTDGKACFFASRAGGSKSMSNGATSLRCYVSYAWADDDNPEREAQVDALVEQARRKGVDVVRDKDVLKAGDRISDFMRRIGGSDRIFVFLSHKYLTSAFCMNKLFLIWRNSREDESDFLSRVRVYTLDDARFDRFEDRLSYAKYWRNEHDRLKEIIKGSLSEVSDFDYRRFRLMDQFATNIGDILALFSDTVRPRSFEDFLKYGFEDGSSAGRAVPRPPAYVPPLAAVAMGGIERPSAAESFVEAAQARWAQEEANRRKTVWRIVGALSIVAVAIALAVAVSRSTLRPSGWFSGTSTDKRPSYTSSIDVSSPASTDIAWCYQGAPAHRTIRCLLLPGEG